MRAPGSSLRKPLEIGMDSASFTLVPGKVFKLIPSSFVTSTPWIVVLPSVNEIFNMRGLLCDSSLTFGAAMFRILVTWKKNNFRIKIEHLRIVTNSVHTLWLLIFNKYICSLPDYLLQGQPKQTGFFKLLLGLK